MISAGAPSSGYGMSGSAIKSLLNKAKIILLCFGVLKE